MIIGSAWRKTSTSGEKYTSVEIQCLPLAALATGKLSIALFTNRDKKEGSNQPDAVVVWSPPKKQDRPANAGAGGDAEGEDDIPF